MPGTHWRCMEAMDSNRAIPLCSIQGSISWLALPFKRVGQDQILPPSQSDCFAMSQLSSGSRLSPLSIYRSRAPANHLEVHRRIFSILFIRGQSDLHRQDVALVCPVLTLTCDAIIGSVLVERYKSPRHQAMQRRKMVGKRQTSALMLLDAVQLILA